MNAILHIVASSRDTAWSFVRFRYRLIIFCAYVIVAYLFFGRGLSYQFWADDWNYLWLVGHPFRFPIVSWLHPGTMVEFIVLDRVLGYMQVHLWQHVGILLKACAAFAVMDLAFALTKARRAAICSGFIYAVLPSGMEAIHWASAHIVLFDVIVSAEAIALYIQQIRGQLARVWVVWVVVIIAIVIDPIRMVALLWVPYFVSHYLAPKAKHNRILDPAKIIFIVLGGAIYALLAVWQALAYWARDYGSAASLVDSIEKIRYLPGMVLYAVGSWAWPTMNKVQEMHPIISLAACITVVLGARYIFQKRNTTPALRLRTLMIFSGVWIVTTVITQWAYDPDGLFTVAHRYFVLPGVGVALLLGYLVSVIPHRMRYVVLLVIVGTAFVTTNRVFADMDRYRGEDILRANWALLTNSVGKSSAPLIYIEGAEDIRPYDFIYDYQSRYTFVRWKEGDNQRPFVTSNLSDIMLQLCQDDGFGRVITAVDVYAFSVSPDGVMHDIRNDVLEQLRAGTHKEDCLTEVMAP